MPTDHRLMLNFQNALECISADKRRDLAKDCLSYNVSATVEKKKIIFSVFLLKGLSKVPGGCEPCFCASLSK